MFPNIERSRIIKVELKEVGSGNPMTKRRFCARTDIVPSVQIIQGFERLSAAESDWRTSSIHDVYGVVPFGVRRPYSCPSNLQGPEILLSPMPQLQQIPGDIRT